MSPVGTERNVSFEVVAGTDDVGVFAASLGGDATRRLPTTYPIRWLTRPEIVDAVRALAADKPASLPVHELQTVDMLAELPLDAPMALLAEIRRTDDIHISIDALVARGEQPVARLHALLRLVP